MYLDFLRTRAYPQLDPDFADICSFPRMKESIDLHAHNSTRWGPGALEEVHDYLPDRILQWQHATRHALLAKIPHNVKHPNPIHPAYNLAVVWFKARTDSRRSRDRIVQFPQVLRVRFVSSQERKFDDGWSPAVHRRNALLAWPHPVPWLEAEEEIVFAPKAAKLACEVVQKVGLNPATTLQADMDALDPRLVCTCESPGYVSNWRRMVSSHRLHQRPSRY